MKNYTKFLNEQNNSIVNKKINKYYKSVIKMVDSFYISKLNMNIIPYYNIYQTLSRPTYG